MVLIRPAATRDASAMARLHASRISEGFLSSLGTPFLTLLYRRVVRDRRSFAFVAADDGEVVGFAAVATDVGALYRAFIVRDGVAAGAVAALPLVRSWRRVTETLRYPGSTVELPEAEVLSVAVDERVGGKGVGRRLVEASLSELAQRYIATAKVVAGAGNTAAIALYEATGFEIVEHIEVHDGTKSAVLVWDALREEHVS